MTTNYLFLLGADDPEMRRIEEILEWANCSFQYATQGDKRVHPGNAYKADPISLSEGSHLVLIECEPTSIPDDMYRIDHHRPGGPGYGLPPNQFLEASSLGQLANFLDIIMSLSQDDIILAAMDHCPANAIRGECPGVTAEEVIERKVQEISKATEVSPRDVHERIVQLAERLEAAPEVIIGDQTLKDMRAYDTGSGYALDYLCSQVVALANGYGMILLTHDRGDSRNKWTIVGHCTPHCIEGFINEWAPSQGLTGIYGVPNRGYAGGYLSA